MTPMPDRIGCSTLEIAFMALENATILKGFLTGLFSSVSLSKKDNSSLSIKGSWLEWFTLLQQIYDALVRILARITSSIESAKGSTWLRAF